MKLLAYFNQLIYALDKSMIKIPNEKNSILFNDWAVCIVCAIGFCNHIS